MEIPILSDTHIFFLKKLGKEKSLAHSVYLSGGTALSAFYLNHRHSDDLDFFSEYEIDLLPVNIFLGKIKKEIGFSQIDFRQHQNRNIYHCCYDSKILKMEFTYYPFPRIEKSILKYGVEIDSALDIAVNKIFTIYQRSMARDYIDLYFLCKEKKYIISDLILHAKAKFDRHIDSIQLGTQFVKALEVMDFPKMIASVPHVEWQNFFVKEAKNLKKDILK